MQAFTAKAQWLNLKKLLSSRQVKRFLRYKMVVIISGLTVRSKQFKKPIVPTKHFDCAVAFFGKIL